MRRLVLALTAALLLAACGSQAEDETEATDDASGEADQSSEESEDQSDPDGDLSAALLLVQQRGDRGVVDATVDGFEAGAEEFGYSEAQILVVEDPATYLPTLRGIAEEGTDLIIGTFPPLADAFAEIAPEFPETKFALIDAPVPEDLDNAQELWFAENESSYLAGVAAGMATETDRVGFIGGVDGSDVLNRYLVGYYAGVKDTDADAVICWAWADSMQDPARGKEIALSLFDDDIDVLHAASAATQLGIYEAAEEEDKLMISADVDVRPLAPNVGMFSTGPFFDEAARQLMADVASDKFQSGYVQYGMESGLVGRTEFADWVPQDIQEAVIQAEEDISSGAIEVPGLEAMDTMSNCS